MLSRVSRVLLPAVLAASVIGVQAADAPLVKAWLTVPAGTQRLSQVAVQSSSKAAGAVAIDVDTGTRYQRMMGFGSSITDASAQLMQTALSPSQRAAFLSRMFTRKDGGLGLSMTRITLGASDFSTHDYSFDDMPKGQADPTLAHFSLAPDHQYLIPAMHAVQAVQPALRTIASPWSAPGWMKSSDSLITGHLLPKYQSVFANYMIKSVRTLRQAGVPVWAITLQNEPAFEPKNYPGMRMPGKTRAQVIGKYLGPRMAASGLHTEILDWDHNWNHPEQPLTVLRDARASKYVAGVAWHCYEGDPVAQSQVHDKFPHKQVLMTECADGEWEPAKSGGAVWLADRVVLEPIRHWAQAIVLWNLALDPQHGPHLGGCDTCIGTVTIDPANGHVTPMNGYYALGHFSRFVVRGAVRVKSSRAAHGVANVAFVDPDGTRVLVVINRAKSQRKVQVAQGGTHFGFAMPARSLATFTWSD
nr:glycoside hydrolase family 30 beta sandwich domain-containing protein [Oleiagrimonas sp. C23AA]